MSMEVCDSFLRSCGEALEVISLRLHPSWEKKPFFRCEQALSQKMHDANAPPCALGAGTSL